MRSLSRFEELQVPLMASLAPAAWLPFLSAGHTASNTFYLPTAVDVVPGIVELAVDAMAADSKPYNSYMDVRPYREGGRRIDVRVVTKIGWLDLMTIKWCRHEQSGGTQVQTSGCSTGILPLKLPGAALINILLFWCPFGGVSRLRLKEFETAAEVAAGRADAAAAKVSRT